MRMMGKLDQLVHIPAHQIILDGQLKMPEHPQGVVLFAHGSGSTRHSPRNNFVADQLRAAGLGTLLIDLLSPHEDVYYNARFDIGLLTRRLLDATRWLHNYPASHGLPIGYFGASTGAAAALNAAAEMGNHVGAVVSRGGRPDLAGEALSKVVSPTLLLVGGNDPVVIGINREAAARMAAPHKVAVIPGASHLFEETGALQQVAEQAAGWFARYLKPHQKAA